MAERGYLGGGFLSAFLAKLIDWRRDLWVEVHETEASVEYGEDGSISPMCQYHIVTENWATGGTYKKFTSGGVEFESKYENPVYVASPLKFNALWLGGLCPSAWAAANIDDIDQAILVGWQPKVGTSHKLFVTIKDAVMTVTDLDPLGIDFTVKHKYKIVWDEPSVFYPYGRVRLYIDDVLRATHVSNIPVKTCSFVVSAYGYKSDAKSTLYSFKDLGPIVEPLEWAYKREVTIDEQAGATYTDYPTIITVPYNPHMRNDFADCRFGELDGTPIPFGIFEKTDGVSCQFVMKRNYTPGSSQKVMLYYGNPSGISVSVDYGPWALAWYQNHGFGKFPFGYSMPACGYEFTLTGSIPAWADVVVGALAIPNYLYADDTGRVEINGVPAAWATTDVCNGQSTPRLVKWKKYQCSEQQYDHPGFIKGAVNTIKMGHITSSPYKGWYCSWYPKDPLITIGPEQPI